LEPALVPVAVVPDVPEAGAAGAADGVVSADPPPPPLPVFEVELFVDTLVTLAGDAGEPVDELLMVTTLWPPCVPPLEVGCCTFTVEPPVEACFAGTVVFVGWATVVGVDATVVGGAVTVVGGAGATVVVVVAPASGPLAPGAPTVAGLVWAPAGRAHSNSTRPRARSASAASRAGRTPSILELELVAIPRTPRPSLRPSLAIDVPRRCATTRHAGRSG
jgi:hypothetical protein